MALAPEGLRDSGQTAKGHVRGTDRLVAPCETLSSVVPRMRDMGITRLANITGLDVIGIPVVMACRPNARGLSVTQGKGLDLDAAKASALMEAVESYHAENITQPLVLGTYDELKCDMSLVDPIGLPVETGAFDTGQTQLWIEGNCLLSSEGRWLPFDMVHTDFTYGSRIGRGQFDITTNGLSSGNHLLEATSHGICEIIERDALALWYQQPEEMCACSRVRVESIDDEACGAVIEQLAAVGVSVGVWEITSDIALPAFFCAIGEERRSSWQTLFGAQGMGCHPKREIALLRALTEAVQARLTAIAGSRDDIFRSDYERMRDTSALRQTEELLAAHQPIRDFHEAPTHDNPSFEEDIALELALLQQAGVKEVITVDLTKQEFNIPVVRTVIPDLEFYVKTSLYRPGPRAKARGKALRWVS